jgi:hypothetical protein
MLSPQSDAGGETMTPTTEQLKDLLAKVTQGEWRISERGTNTVKGALGERVAYPDPADLTEAEMAANATLIALAPTLAAEVVRLRDALTRLGTAACFGNGETLGMSLMKDPFGREILSRMEFARQALDATAQNRQ